ASTWIRDAPAACKAGIVVILTPGLLPMRAVRVPPRITPTHGAARGTVKVLSRLLSAGHPTGCGVPARVATLEILRVKKSGISPPTRTAALRRAAISAALLSLGNSKGRVGAPAQVV